MTHGIGRAAMGAALVAMVAMVATVGAVALAGPGSEWPLQKIAAPPVPLTSLCRRILHGDTYVSYDVSYGSKHTPAQVIAHYEKSRPGVRFTREAPDRASVHADDGPHREVLRIGPMPTEGPGCSGTSHKEHLTLLKMSRETSGPPR